MTTETKVEAVAWIDPQGYLIDNGRFQSRVDGALDFGDLSAYQPLYPASAITALEGEVERLRGERSALIASIQSAVTNVAVPKMTESRAEYFKAGARATIAAVNGALTKESP